MIRDVATTAQKLQAGHSSQTVESATNFVVSLGVKQANTYNSVKPITQTILYCV